MTASHSFGPLIDSLCRGEDRGRAPIEAFFHAVMTGEVNGAVLSAVLIALKAKGETAQEIAGAVSALRAAATPFDLSVIGPEVANDAVDNCGTGGDGAHTINISTAAAIVAASAGLHLVKHGNRSVSSQCGSADVLEACGVVVDTTASISARCLREHGICFLYAPQYHPAIRHAMPVRRAIGVRTLFNLLGPLVNPAQPKRQLVGVYANNRLKLVAETLSLLGTERCLVVHGGGTDEVALHAETHAVLWDGERHQELVLTPEQAGLKRSPLASLRGGDAAFNAAALRAVLEGKGTDAHQHAVALNAGALFWAVGHAQSFRDGVHEALETLASGAPRATLDAWARTTHGP